MLRSSPPHSSLGCVLMWAFAYFEISCPAAGNSFIQNLYAPDPDPEMTVDEYERDEEQDAELGLAAPTY